MTATHFVDTNVLLYAASNAPTDQPNRRIARQVLTDPNICFSAQVLQEFYSAAVTKQRLQKTHDEAVTVLASLAAFPVWPITRDLVLEAVAAKQQFQISYWDAAILTAARQMGCQTIYSEDFDSSRDYDGLRVVNPFQP
jgi:predicted nucleic acid-binding protein